jgi:hypothetical protein
LAEVIEHAGKHYIAKGIRHESGRTIFWRWSRQDGRWLTQAGHDCSFPSGEEARAFLEVAEEIAPAVSRADTAFLGTHEDEKGAAIERLEAAAQLAFTRLGVTLDNALKRLRRPFEDRNIQSVLNAPSIGNGPLEAALIVADLILKDEGSPSLTAS